MALIGFTVVLYFIGLFVLATIISGFFIMIGAKVAGVENAGFGKAFWAALLCSFFVWALTGIASAILAFGSIAVWLIGLVITLLIIKWVFKTTWGKALLTWVFHGIAQLIVLAIAVVLMLTGIVVFFF
jgi:hypothetical protein